MPLSTIFQYLSWGVCFIGGETGVPWDKTTNLLQVTDKHFPMPELKKGKPSEEEEKIGKLIADNLVEDGATLQMGLFYFVTYTVRTRCFCWSDISGIYHTLESRIYHTLESRIYHTLEPRIYHTRGGHVNYYTTDAVQ
jgi:hypothetical protein